MNFLSAEYTQPTFTPQGAHEVPTLAPSEYDMYDMSRVSPEPSPMKAARPTAPSGALTGVGHGTALPHGHVVAGPPVATPAFQQLSMHGVAAAAPRTPQKVAPLPQEVALAAPVIAVQPADEAPSALPTSYASCAQPAMAQHASPAVTQLLAGLQPPAPTYSQATLSAVALPAGYGQVSSRPQSPAGSVTHVSVSASASPAASLTNAQLPMYGAHTAVPQSVVPAPTYTGQSTISGSQLPATVLANQAPATRRYSGASASGYPQQLPPAAYAASAALPPSPAGALVAANAQPGPAPVPQYRDYPQSPFPAGQEADYIVPTRFAGQEADYVVPTRFESDEQVMRRLSNGSGFSDSRPSTPLRQPLYQAFPEDYGAAYKIAGAAPVRSKSPGVATAYQTPGYQGPTYQAAAYQTPTYQSPGSPAYQGYGAPELRSRSPFVGRELPFDASPQVPQVPVQPPVQQGPPPAAPYGQQPPAAPYGQQPPAAPYGQQPPAAPYGQQPAQYGPPGAAPPAAFGAPPPPAPAEWEYAPPALQPQRKSGLISRAGRLFHRDKGDTMANGLALRRFAPVAGDCLAVSSKANPRDAAHFVPPFTLTVPAEDANRRIIQILMTQSQSRTLVNEGPYIRFEIQLPGLDACDDMEYEFDKRHGVVHVRCEQRGGPSDINGLVARVTSIFTMLEEDIHKFPHPGEAPGVYYQ